jgi:hypothetical protein
MLCKVEMTHTKKFFTLRMAKSVFRGMRLIPETKTPHGFESSAEMRPVSRSRETISPAALMLCNAAMTTDYSATPNNEEGCGELKTPRL